jgi:hypothetical protein
MRPSSRVALGSFPLITALLCSGCGGSSSTTKFSTAIPSIAVTSPTVAKANSSRSRGRSRSAVETTSQLSQDIANILASTTKAQCFQNLNFSATAPLTACYGPMLVYKNNPNGAGSTQPGCPSGAGVYCLPTGDLGIWPTASGPVTAVDTTGEACASAEMNSLVVDVSNTVNTAIKLMAGLACLAQLDGDALPAPGASLDLSADTQASYSGSTVTTAAIAQESAPVGGFPVYRLTFQGTIGGLPVSLTLRHSPNSNGTDSAGRVYGTVGVDASSVRGFSIVYNRTAGVDSFVAKSAITPNSAGTSGLFDSSGNYQWATFLANGSAGSSDRDARFVLTQVSDSTNLGTMLFAWQAGGSDTHTRVLNATTTAGAGGAADSGYAYFGFGAPMGTSSGSILGMCCNWAGPGGTCIQSSGNYDKSGLAENQVFSRSLATGYFVPTSSNITYAPLNSCDYDPTSPPGGTFIYSTVPLWNPGSMTPVAVTNNLQSLTAVGVIPTLTAPVF